MDQQYEMDRSSSQEEFDMEDDGIDIHNDTQSSAIVKTPIG